MTISVFLGLNCLLGYPQQALEVGLTAVPMTSKVEYRLNSSIAQIQSGSALLQGYRLPKNIKASHCGAVYIAGKRIVFYGVQDKLALQLEEIGVDFNRNKVFENKEIGYLTGKPLAKGPDMAYAFKNDPNPLVLLSAHRTNFIEISPARLLRGSATIGGRAIQFTVGDSNYDGAFGKDDVVGWAFHSMRSQALSTLFVMPDGRYYTASMPSQSILRFTPDKRPTGTVSIKGGQLESCDIRLKEKRFDPIIQNGLIVLPEGDYLLNVLVYSTTGTNGKPCRIGVWGPTKPYRIAGGKDLCLDPGPINRVGIRVSRGSKAHNLQLEAFTKGGYTVYALNFRQGNSLSRPPAPVVEIVDPTDAVVAKVTLKYG